MDGTIIRDLEFEGGTLLMENFTTNGNCDILALHFTTHGAMRTSVPVLLLLFLLIVTHQDQLHKYLFVSTKISFNAPSVDFS